jgi:hypothetical protein
MAPKEVAGLQELAQRHGGSLTTNPHTGLPEAGFLESLLPMALGAGAMMLPGMQGIGAGYIGAGLGAIEGLRTGSLKQGLLAGLGAYGGASMAGGLLGSGAMSADSLAEAKELQIAQADAANKALGARAQQEAAQEAARLSAKIAQQQADTLLANQSGKSFMDSLSSNFSTAGKGFSNGFGNFSNSVGMGPGSIGLKTALGAAAIPAVMGAYDDSKEQGAPAQKTNDSDLGAYAKSGAQFYPNYVGPYENKVRGGEYTYARPYYGAEGGAVGMADGGVTGMAMGGIPQRDAYQEYMDYYNNAFPPLSKEATTVAPFKYPEPTVAAPAPATPFLQAPVYNNTQPQTGGSGGQTAEQRAEREKAWSTPQDYLSIDRYDPEATARVTKTENAEPGDRYAPARETVKDVQSNESMAAMGPAERAMHMADVRAISPIRTGVYDAFTNIGVLPIAAKVYENFKYGDLGRPLPPGAPKAPVRDVQPGEFNLTPAGVQAVVAASNAAANKTYGNSAPSGPANDGRADPSGVGGTSYGAVDAGYTGGSEAATGGLSTLHGFEHMARGGNVHGNLRPPAAFFQKGKFTTQPAKMYADGGISDTYNLGSYSDGGRLLKGPGDGVSDSIPATIGKGQPARLADGEFVIPARIVSEIGNGSTEAGARKLYAMMDRIQAGRKKSVGRGKVAVNSRADRYLPA